MQVVELALDGDLEVVARDGLVVRRRRHLVERSRLGLVRVDEVDARSRAIGRGREVEGGRRLRRRVRLDRADLAGCLGQPAEPARRHGRSMLDLATRQLDEVVGLGHEVRRIRIQGAAQRGDVVVAQRSRDGQAVAIDGFQLREPVLVELEGRQRQRRRGQDGRRVDGLPVRQRPDAIARARPRGGASDRFEEARDRRLDMSPDRRGQGLALRVAEARSEPDDQRRLVGRSGDHPLELLDGALEDDRRCGPTSGQALFDVADVGVDVGRVGGEARQEVLEGLVRVDGQQARQVARQALRPVEVVDRA